MNHLRPEADEEEKQLRTTSRYPCPFSATLTLPMTLLALILSSSLAMNVYFVATAIVGSATTKSDTLSVDVDSSRRSLNGVDCHQTPLALQLELDSESETASTANATSENVSPSSDNPGTITLKPEGGMIVSGLVKLTADIEVEGKLPFGVAGITLLPGAVLDCNDHSITGDPVDGNTGISVEEGDGAKIMNCHVKKFGGDGLYIDYAKDVTIEHSSFNDNLGDGIYGINSSNNPDTLVGTFEMNDVRASNNGDRGICIEGWGTAIRLNKIVANENGEEALLMRNRMSTLPLNNIQVKDITALNNYQQGNTWINPRGGTITAAIAKMISIEKATVVGGSGLGKNGISVLSPPHSVELRDITVEDTDESGIYAYIGQFGNTETNDGVITTLEDVIAEQSDSHGLEYGLAGKLVFKGLNHFGENEGAGLVLFPEGATASVSHGKVTSNGNQAGGMSAKFATFEVEKKGSVVACGNKDFDVEDLFSTSTFTGHNYICDHAIGAGSPQCKPCKTAKSRK